MSSKSEMAQRERNAPQNLRGRPVVRPAVDIFENKDEYLILTDVPGVASEGLEVRFDDGELAISAHWDEPEDQGGELGREFRALEYRRRFVVPESVDVEKIVASLDSGVLSVHLPKADAVKPRKIQINVV